MISTFSFFTEEIIKSSLDNSAGTLVDENGIEEIVNIIINSHNLDIDYIDKLIDKNESESGFIILANDIISVIKPFIETEPEEIYQIEKPERDYEMIELMFGDWHSECGDR